MAEIDEPVRLSAYQEDWPGVFAAERLRLAGSLGLSSEAFEHIGSTAVPGLMAKPVIDIMLGVRDLASSRAFAEPLARMGYEDFGEAGVAGRFYYRRRGDADYNLHVVEADGTHWLHNIALRDLLRTDPAARERYRAAKLAALAAGANTLLAYSQAKGPAIEALLQLALFRGR
jgi:GrpB-like predicted nucleotidyltransferase (UPF0157 family)